MRPNALRILATAFLALTIAACAPFPAGSPAPPRGSLASGSTVAAGRSPRGGWLSSAAKHGRPLIYVANGNEVDIFPENGHHPPLIGAISEGVDDAYGLHVDARGYLYVANRGSNSVTVYPPGSLKPSMTYSRGLDVPLYTSTDAAGDVAISSAHIGRVAVYPPGQTKPQRYLRVPTDENDGLAFDAAGNLYVAFRATGVGSIEEFTPDSNKGRRLGMRIRDPQGLVIDGSGNLLVVETGRRKFVDVFPPGSTQPSQRVKVPYSPTQLALTAGPSQTVYLSNWYNGRIYSGPYPLREIRNVKIENPGLTHVQGLAVSNSVQP